MLSLAAANSNNAAGARSACASLVFLRQLTGAWCGWLVDRQLARDGEPGFQYIIENSTNCVDWTPILTNAAPLAFVDRNATNWPAQFYRAIGQPAQ